MKVSVAYIRRDVCSTGPGCFLTGPRRNIPTYLHVELRQATGDIQVDSTGLKGPSWLGGTDMSANTGYEYPKPRPKGVASQRRKIILTQSNRQTCPNARARPRSSPVDVQSGLLVPEGIDKNRAKDGGSKEELRGSILECTQRSCWLPRCRHTVTAVRL